MIGKATVVVKTYRKKVLKIALSYSIYNTIFIVLTIRKKLYKLCG